MPLAAKMSLSSSGKGWIVSPSLCLWWSGKDQPSVPAAQGERGRTKSMLDWGELKSSSACTSSTCLKWIILRQKMKSISYVRVGKGHFKIFLSLVCDQTTVTVGKMWITFSVYCAISLDLKHQITGGLPESLGTSDLAVFLLTEL